MNFPYNLFVQLMEEPPDSEDETVRLLFDMLSKYAITFVRYVEKERPEMAWEEREDYEKKLVVMLNKLVVGMLDTLATQYESEAAGIFDLKLAVMDLYRRAGYFYESGSSLLSMFLAMRELFSATLDDAEEEE